MNATQEQWRPVVGWEGYYEVSDQGRVRSLDRRVYAGPGRWGQGFWRQHHGQLVGPNLGGRYAKVQLKRDGNGHTFNVHQLVAEAFLGPRPDGLEVCHNNGQHHDNRAANLRYDTHSANGLDAVKHGANVWSSRTHCGRGHEYTPENTAIGRSANGRPTRRCRACRAIRAKKRWQATRKGGR